MHDLTPWSGLLGGALIGLAASLLLLGIGRIAGVSGMLAGAVLGARGDRAWRACFLLGLLAAGLVAAAWAPAAITPSPRPVAWLGMAGLLVGVGTQVGGGCTSGHGVCGLSRLSPRSMVATSVFVASGMLTVTLLRLLGLSQ